MCGCYFDRFVKPEVHHIRKRHARNPEFLKAIKNANDEVGNEPKVQSEPTTLTFALPCARLEVLEKFHQFVMHAKQMLYLSFGRPWARAVRVRDLRFRRKIRRRIPTLRLKARPKLRNRRMGHCANHATCEPAISF